MGEKEAGLLPLLDVDAEVEPVLDDGTARRGAVAAREADSLLQALQCSYFGVRALGRRSKNTGGPGAENRLRARQPRRVALSHHRVRAQLPRRRRAGAEDRLLSRPSGEPAPRARARRE